MNTNAVFDFVEKKMDVNSDQNPNSPDNLLGSWLKANIATMSERGHGPIEQVADLLLAHILDFADDHSKLDEMYAWLCSKHGGAFFARKEFDPFGKAINHAVDRLDSDFASHRYELEDKGVPSEVIDDDETWKSFVYEYIATNNETLRYRLTLK